MFGNFEDVTVRVFKYEDVNSNGVYDAGDVPLPDWTIEMYSLDYGIQLTEETGPDGYATFVLQAGGPWLINEYPPDDGWCQITPVEGGYWYTRLVRRCAGCVRVRQLQVRPDRRASSTRT